MNEYFQEDVWHKKGSSISSCLSFDLSILLRTLSWVLFLCVLNKTLSQILFIENRLYIDRENHVLLFKSMVNPIFYSR